jgi:DNA ligase 1
VRELYSLSYSTNKIKYWSIAVKKKGTVAEIIIIHGWADGRRQKTIRTIHSGKNLGKTNETTPYQQAINEAQSAYEKKVREGYTTKIPDKIAPHKKNNELSLPFKPMLAKPYKDQSHKIVFPCYAQPKLDGHRMIAAKKDGEIQLWSRGRKPIITVEEIATELKLLLEEGDCVDGELYLHGVPLQRLSSWIRKRRKNTAILEYHIYDIPSKWSSDFQDRLPVLETLKQKASTLKHIKIVETVLITDTDALEAYEVKQVAQKYEGIMVRNASGEYAIGSRSSNLLKIKRFDDAEFEIIGGKEGTGKDVGTIIFTCKTTDGIPFDCRPTGSHTERTKMFNELETLIGKMLTVKFKGLTEKGIPYIPVGLQIREDL